MVSTSDFPCAGYGPSRNVCIHKLIIKQENASLIKMFDGDGQKEKERIYGTKNKYHQFIIT